MSDDAPRPTRRVLLLGATGVVAGCSTTDAPARRRQSTGSTTPTSVPAGGGTTTPAVDWVVTENALPGADWRRPSATMATDDELCGYPLRVVIDVGDPLELAVRSSLGSWSATVLRIGHYGGKGSREVHRVEAVAPTAKPRPDVDPRDRCVTAGWKADVSIPTAGWPAGAYLVVLEAGGRWRYTTFVIRSRSSEARLALVLATTTWAAYNTWGGYSLYRGPTAADPRAHRVSHDRPQDGNGAPKLLSFEAAAIRLAEQLGLPVAYLGSADLEHAERVEGAVGIVSLGHDEYWSAEMRDVVTGARDAGTNLAFLGANACYWRVRIEDDGQSVVCHKVDPDPVRGRTSTTLWRQGDRPEPENSLTGMLYECFPARGELTVVDPDSFLFVGTGAHRGSRYPGIVGTEVDRAYPVAGTPPSLQVLCHSAVDGPPGVRTHSDLTYYRAEGGAGVVATGTMQWTWVLLGPNRRLGITAESVDLVRTVTSNLLTAMTTPRLGDLHPPRPNLASIGANASTASGTGGRIG